MKFHKMMGIISLILFTIFIISSIVFGVTAEKVFGNVGHSMKFLIDIPDYHKMDPTDDSLTIVSDSNTFKPLSNININCSFEDIEFIYEDRADIFIKYHYAKPNNQFYKIKVDLYDKNDTIYIDATTTFKKFQHLKYDSKITIHLPEEHHFDNYELDKDIGEITDISIPKNTDNININIDAGNISFETTTPVNDLLISANATSIDIKTLEDINNLNISCDFGDVSITAEKTVNDLKINTNAASIVLNTHDTVNHVDINSDFGDLTGNLYGHIDKLIADLDAGDLVFNTYANDDSKAYINVDLGNIESDLPQVKKSTDPDFIITANLGSVTINQIE